MSILRANVDYAMSISRARDRKSYGYGGTWSKNDVNRTTDCSGIVTHNLDALVNGANMAWSRHGISTEAYREAGNRGVRGPFGTIRVNSPGAIPSDAALKIGLFHGPGGGANSHMACTLEGVAIESSGSYGQRVGGPARGYNHSMFRDWWYLPGPIVGEGATPGSSPQAPGAIYLGRNYESYGERVLALQKALNADPRIDPKIETDSEFGPATEAAVRQFQQLQRLEIDGIAGPATLAALKLFQPAPPPPAPGTPPIVAPPQTFQEWIAAASDRKLLEYLVEQAGPGHPAWPSAGTTQRDKVWSIAKKLGTE